MVKEEVMFDIMGDFMDFVADMDEKDAEAAKEE